MKLKADVAVLAFLLLAETHMSVSIAGTIEVVSAPEGNWPNSRIFSPVSVRCRSPCFGADVVAHFQ